MERHGRVGAGGPRAARGLMSVPPADMPPHRLVLAWNSAGANPLIRSAGTSASPPAW
ncbi:UNVERIFIED_ORG: hypothetical protein FHR35_004227 [Microbispora rosea subsp. rosea]